jgi:hypothetical protein
VLGLELKVFNLWCVQAGRQLKRDIVGQHKGKCSNSFNESGVFKCIHVQDRNINLITIKIREILVYISFLFLRSEIPGLLKQKHGVI